MENIAKEIIEGLEEAIDFAKGRKTGAKAHALTLEDIVSVRKKTRLSQSKFADLFGISVSTLRNWEQGRRYPQGASLTLLRVIKNNPQAVFKALEMDHETKPH